MYFPTEWRHVKTGHTYQLDCFVRHSETLELMVVYGNESGDWVRPAAMFFDGRFVPDEYDDVVPKDSVKTVHDIMAEMRTTSVQEPLPVSEMTDG